MLVGFVAWERRVGQRAAVQPLVELRLFRSAGFTWGTMLTTLVSFALFGILFAMPQYFQDVRGLDALGSGLRLLPLIGGMVVGMLVGTRLQAPRKDPAGLPGSTPLASAKALVTLGFGVMAAALAVGAFTRVSSGTGFGAAWFTAVGAGLGLAMPAAMNAALGALSAERSGSGSALITMRKSLAGGIAVAHEAGSKAQLDDVRIAFAHALDVMLWVCGGIALAATVLALAFLPRWRGAAGRGTERVRAADEIGV